MNMLGLLFMEKDRSFWVKVLFISLIGLLGAVVLPPASWLKTLGLLWLAFLAIAYYFTHHPLIGWRFHKPEVEDEELLELSKKKKVMIVQEFSPQTKLIKPSVRRFLLNALTVNAARWNIKWQVLIRLRKLALLSERKYSHCWSSRPIKVTHTVRVWPK